MELSYVLSVIDEMKDEWYKPPSSEYVHRKKIDFEYQSYRHSAIHEIRWYLIKHGDQNVFETLMDFFYETKDRSSIFMFSVYCEVVLDVLDVLYGMGGDV